MEESKITAGIERFEKWTRWLNWAVVVAGIILLVGVVGEPLSAGNILYPLLVAIGVFGEVTSGVIHIFFDTRLSDLRSQERRVYETVLAQLRKDAAEANARAAEANEKAEEERLARVKIEERLAPRQLSQEQRQSISVRLLPLIHKRVGLILCANNVEAATFAGQIGGAFFLAGIDVRQAQRTSGGVLPGVAVEFEGADDIILAARAIISALAEEGVSVFSEPMLMVPGTFSGDPEASRAPIRVEIGEKP